MAAVERFVDELLGLQVGAAPRQLNQSFIYMIELWLPEKAPALRYLQCAERSGRNCAAPPARSARAIVFHGAPQKLPLELLTSTYEYRVQDCAQ